MLRCKIYDKVTKMYVGTINVEMTMIRKYEKDFIVVRS